ncbi:hypothetical protein AK812_SmicGene34924 [Symbiodinium microadriaticum]|uniref:Uncharacterized protein n=1 Tax=Symbiodinium microadriaticum TaxID=2951 RepID=A0A1Q9CMR7_SYMMI|nr:hypothetical protein AK812_SmicGene34924 [Symbiodinium microadriaticum]
MEIWFAGNLFRKLRLSIVGHKRRKRLKAGVAKFAKRLLGNARAVLAGVYIAAAALAVAAASAVPSFSRMRPDILEICGQQAQFTSSFSQGGWRSSEPFQLSSDLCDEGSRDAMSRWIQQSDSRRQRKKEQKVIICCLRIADTRWTEKNIMKALGRWSAAAVYALDEHDDDDEEMIPDRQAPSEQVRLARCYSGKKADNHSSWRGPGYVVGLQDRNAWVAIGGRCFLVAGEHLREAVGDEKHVGNPEIQKAIALFRKVPSEATYEDLLGQSDPEGEPMDVEHQPLGQDLTEIIKLLKPVYGRPDAPRAWYEELSRILQEELGFIKSKVDPAICFEINRASSVV